ncbi:unnamed protein product [Diatraea saccharalis]|uniref:Ethanolaminephosphotransferase n=1 Tax=Diatraea saccharalis TaxID=40085 RepID=A0A9N9RB12_9NEOP|nr:unnamed protein product [Diatraea saccharalis]
MEKLFNYKYLDKNHLKGFHTYKYSAIDTSPLSNYVMHPLWNASVKLLPKWIAPNLLTFAGFLLMVASVVLLGLYDYGCYGPLRDNVQVVPDWVFTVCAVFIFVAYNLDGMDGKQARRIGVSGPLGEMFDHGLDSYVVFFIPYALMTVFGRDNEYTVSVFRGFILIMSVSLNFYVSHCEKYNTGTLYLPWGYDISMWVSSLLFLVPGLYGPRVYHIYLFGYKFVNVLEVVVHATGLFTTLPIAFYNVYMAKKNNTIIYKSILDMVRPVWSMLIMNATILVWVIKSPNNILEYDPKAFILLYGTHFSNIACRLIVAEMSKQKCDIVTWMCWPLRAAVAISLFFPHIEIIVFYCTFFFSLAAHLHYGVCVVIITFLYYSFNLKQFKHKFFFYFLTFLAYLVSKLY